VERRCDDPDGNALYLAKVLPSALTADPPSLESTLATRQWIYESNGLSCRHYSSLM
jgi:hypothetical protein